MDASTRNVERYDRAVSTADDRSPFERHFLEPHGQGALEDATHGATATDPACGDELTLDLRVAEGVIEAARFRVRGCSGAIAVGSALATLLPGRPARADAVDRAALEAELGGLPASKRHVLRLAQRTLGAALQGNSSIT